MQVCRLPGREGDGTGHAPYGRGNSEAGFSVVKEGGRGWLASISTPSYTISLPVNQHFPSCRPPRRPLPSLRRSLKGTAALFKARGLPLAEMVAARPDLLEESPASLKAKVGGQPPGSLGRVDKRGQGLGTRWAQGLLGYDCAEGGCELRRWRLTRRFMLCSLKTDHARMSAPEHHLLLLVRRLTSCPLRWS